jgi:YjbE family integral membrane protein
MLLDGNLAFLASVFEVFVIDLLLSGDNALVIALACRSLPARQMRTAALVGVVAAIALRVYLTTMVSYVLDIPCVKLAGAAILLLIAIKLTIEDDKRPGHAKRPPAARQSQDLWAAIALITIADLVMSLDNVVALAAVSHGSIPLLAFGLVLSMPLLMYGSFIVAALVNRYPGLIKIGGALLGWIAGDLAVGDPLVAGWIEAQAPALQVGIPLLCALFVLLESRVIDEDRRKAKSAQPTAPAPAASQAAAASGRDETHLVGRINRLIDGTRRRRTKGQPAAPLPAYQPPTHEEALAAGALVLLAEDNPIDQGATRRALERLGYAVETANDGVQALARLAERSYGLLLADYDMPKMDGFQLTADIRRAEQDNGRHLPIIGIIGIISSAQLAQRCLTAGMDDVLRKPVQPDRLDSALARWLPAAASLRRGCQIAEEG